MEADYSFSSDINELQQLYRFLQFLSFSQTQSSESIEIASHKYQLIKFQVQDFLEFIHIQNPSEYKLNQLVDSFRALINTPPLLKVFSESQFQLLATFPFIHVHQTSGRWKAEIYFNSELHTYQYPFSFPKSYLSYQDKYDMQVKLQIIKSFANTTLTKEFKIFEFLQKFRNTPNTTKAHIKHLILKAFQELLQEKLIRKQITLQVLGNERIDKPRLRKTLQIELAQLTPLLIGKTELLSYLEIL